MFIPPKRQPRIRFKSRKHLRRRGFVEQGRPDGTMTTGGVTVTAVPESKIEAYVAYFEAHALLPPMFDGGDPKFAAEVDHALGVAARADADRDALLGALVILGHTPSAQAHEALCRHAASQGALADIAACAAEECQSLRSPGR